VIQLKASRYAAACGWVDKQKPLHGTGVAGDSIPRRQKFAKIFLTRVPAVFLTKKGVAVRCAAGFLKIS